MLKETIKGSLIAAFYLVLGELSIPLADQKDSAMEIKVENHIDSKNLLYIPFKKIKRLNAYISIFYDIRTEESGLLFAEWISPEEITLLKIHFKYITKTNGDTEIDMVDFKSKMQYVIYKHTTNEQYDEKILK